MVSENDGHMDVIAGNYVAIDEAGLLVDRVRQLQERSPEERRHKDAERQHPHEEAKLERRLRHIG